MEFSVLAGVMSDNLSTVQKCRVDTVATHGKLCGQRLLEANWSVRSEAHVTGIFQKIDDPEQRRTIEAEDFQESEDCGASRRELGETWRPINCQCVVLKRFQEVYRSGTGIFKPSDTKISLLDMMFGGVLDTYPLGTERQFAIYEHLTRLVVKSVDEFPLRNKIDLQPQMKCVTLLACLVLSIAVFYAQAMPPPPQCTPGIIEEIPLRMRKLCTALSTIYELSNAMESYLDDKGVVYQQSKWIHFLA
ncbi:hypothetical protein J6590_097505 [Homalodisca vitripennis]|nr:hypothetical protein J6590_097505 [Homalodisca vitripennis]